MISIPFAGYIQNVCLTCLPHDAAFHFSFSYSDMKPVSVYDVASEAQFNLSNIEQDSDCVASFLARFEAYCNASSMTLDDSMLPEHQICPCIPSTLGELLFQSFSISVKHLIRSCMIILSNYKSSA